MNKSFVRAAQQGKTSIWRIHFAGTPWVAHIELRPDGSWTPSQPDEDG